MNKARPAEFWQGLIREQEASGQNVSAFCRGKGLNRDMFFHWRRRILGPAKERAVAKGGFVQLGVPAGAREDNRGLLKVKTNGGIEIELSGGDAVLVRAVLGSVRGL